MNLEAGSNFITFRMSTVAMNSRTGCVCDISARSKPDLWIHHHSDHSVALTALEKQDLDLLTPIPPPHPQNRQEKGESTRRKDRTPFLFSQQLLKLTACLKWSWGREIFIVCKIKVNVLASTGLRTTKQILMKETRLLISESQKACCAQGGKAWGRSGAGSPDVAYNFIS